MVTLSCTAGYASCNGIAKVTEITSQHGAGNFRAMAGLAKFLQSTDTLPTYMLATSVSSYQHYVNGEPKVVDLELSKVLYLFSSASESCWLSYMNAYAANSVMSLSTHV